MGFLRRDDGDDAQSQSQAPEQSQADTTTFVPAEAPHQASYEAGSLAGIPASGRERIARMKEEVARGFFTSDLSVDLGDRRLELRADRGAVQCRSAKLSGGIVLKNEELGMDAWLAMLSEALAAEASRSEATRRALERLLIE